VGGPRNVLGRRSLAGRCRGASRVLSTPGWLLKQATLELQRAGPRHSRLLLLRLLEEATLELQCAVACGGGPRRSACCGDHAEADRDETRRRRQSVGLGRECAASTSNALAGLCRGQAGGRPSKSRQCSPGVCRGRVPRTRNVGPVRGVPSRAPLERNAVAALSLVVSRQGGARLITCHSVRFVERNVAASLSPAVSRKGGARLGVASGPTRLASWSPSNQCSANPRRTAGAITLAAS